MGWMTKAKKAYEGLEKAKKLADGLAKRAKRAKTIFSIADKLQSDKSIDSDVLDLASDGLTALASKCPVVSQYMKYHDEHFKAMNLLLKSVETTENAMRVFDNLTNMAKESRSFSNSVHSQYGFVYEMLDGDGEYPSGKRLPNEFRKYYAEKKEYEFLFKKANEWPLRNCVTRGPKGPNVDSECRDANPFFGKGKIALKRLAQENTKLIIVVHEMAVEVASARLVMSVNLKKFLDLSIEASEKYSKQYNREDGVPGEATSGIAYKNKLEEICLNHSDLLTLSDDFELFKKGVSGLSRMSSFKMQTKANVEMRDLSKKWQDWVAKTNTSFVCMQRCLSR